MDPPLILKLPAALFLLQLLLSIDPLGKVLVLA